MSAPESLREIPLEQLQPSPTNPRKTFDPLALDELALSIATKGLIQPIVVRPHRNGRGADVELDLYEVVAGERRYRACGIAKVETALCLIRDLSDVEVLEIQTIENLQRDDLHPLEEAQGFADLMKKAAYDVDKIAQRIGRSSKYVYDRIKLLRLIPDLQKVFMEGEITAGHAILLARLDPAEQKECLGRADTTYSGLFRPEDADPNPSLELGDPRPRRKAVSVRELDTWINDHVRFKPEEVDLPSLFPETADALEIAAEADLKVIHITRDHQLRPQTRLDGRRTYSRPSWKRADGGLDSDGWGKAKPSKECEHRVLGVVVAGPGRGEAFYVCTEKKKCDVHWKEERKTAEKRKNGSASSSRDSYAEQQKKWAEQRRLEEEERARWKKAGPRLLEVLAEEVKAAPLQGLVDVVLEHCKPYYGKAKNLERGETAEDALRYAAFLVLSDAINDEWRAPREAPKALKPLGINAKKIVDEVAPKPKAEKAVSAKKKAKKKGARARRREKAEASADVSSEATS